MDNSFQQLFLRKQDPSLKITGAWNIFILEDPILTKSTPFTTEATKDIHPSHQLSGHRKDGTFPEDSIHSQKNRNNPASAGPFVAIPYDASHEPKNPIHSAP
jgi:hypothetical protein